ncbi:hypothetical protein SLA2020_102840 [Shorea laevis]
MAEDSKFTDPLLPPANVVPDRNHLVLGTDFFTHQKPQVQSPNGESFRAGTVTFAYRGTPVGKVTVLESGAGARSTNEVDVVVPLSSIGEWVDTSELGRDVSPGVVPLSSYAKLDGEIDLKVIKKKSAEMNCTTEIVTSTASIQNTICK